MGTPLDSPSYTINYLATHTASLLVSSSDIDNRSIYVASRTDLPPTATGTLWFALAPQHVFDSRSYLPPPLLPPSCIASNKSRLSTHSSFPVALAPCQRPVTPASGVFRGKAGFQPWLEVIESSMGLSLSLSLSLCVCVWMCACVRACV